jgi:outer membrane protein OmpA-like peptidoglycan-associated protein
MTSTIKLLSLAAGLGLFALAAGCGASVEPAQSTQGPKLPDPGPDREYAVHFPEAGHGVARHIRLTIDADLSNSCGLMRTYFAFDSDKLSPQDQATLRNVAECLERPDLKDLQLSVVGRADRRGDRKYNADLGLRRAENVKRLLVDAGVAEDRIGIASRGENGARGTNTPREVYSHGYDRRVDVVIISARAPR